MTDIFESRTPRDMDELKCAVQTHVRKGFQFTLKTGDSHLSSCIEDTRACCGDLLVVQESHTKIVFQLSYFDFVVKVERDGLTFTQKEGLKNPVLYNGLPVLEIVIRARMCI